MKKFAVLLLAFALPVLASGQARKVKKANEETEKWRYELETETVGIQGTSVIKVWSYSKDPVVAAEQSKKNAIHGVIFKGVQGKDRIPAMSPLVKESAKESEHAAFFEEFFKDGGDYMRFVTFTNSGDLGGGDVLKTDKKEYKVGVIVTVNYDELRRHLTDKGIIRKASDIF